MNDRLTNWSMYLYNRISKVVETVSKTKKKKKVFNESLRLSQFAQRKRTITMWSRNQFLKSIITF